MKQSYSKVALLQSIMLVFLSLASVTLGAQTIPELIFRSPVLVKGTAGQNGAEYKFSNVSTGSSALDAVVEVKGRSGANVVLNDIDLTSYGWDKAFQPQLGIAGAAAANLDWWMEFEITFYKAGTNTKKTVNKFNVSALDVDGDNGTLQEWAEMEKVKSVSYSPVTYLYASPPSNSNVECSECGKSSLLVTCTNCNGSGMNGGSPCGNCKGSGKLHDECDHAWDGTSTKKIVGPTLNFWNIDTLGTSVMATYTYENRDNIKFKIGAKTGVTGSGAPMRLNSLWFKSFNLAPPITLPVKLTSFTAEYNKPDVMLAWSSSQEMNFSHYVVEHSTDGNVFSETGIVFANENTTTQNNYTYVDRSMPVKGQVIYYRLKMVDTEKNISYSAIRIIRLGEEKQGINITTYPNPAINELRVTIPSSWQAKQVKIELFNSSNGQKIKEVISQNGSQTEMISMSGLGRGMYLLKATCGNETAQQKILKN